MRAGRRQLRVTSGIALLVAGALGTGVAATASAQQSAAPRLRVGDVRTGATTLDARQRFVVRGRVVNRDSEAGPAQLAVTLASGRRPGTAYALGGARIARVPAGRARRFAIRVSAPALRRAFANGFVLRVCVRPRRGARIADCARGARRVHVRLPGATAPPGRSRPTPRPRLPRVPRQPRPRPTPRPFPRPTLPTPPAPPTPRPPEPPIPPPPDPTVYTPGARSLGDSLFPTIGNGGHDARHYDLDLSYANVVTRVLGGTATIEATATQNLSEFSLDFQGLTVTGVTVNGTPASFGVDPAASKLIVTPAQGVRDGSDFTVQVVYGGVPEPVIDPDGSPEGWLSNPTFGAVALGEPLGSQGWFPVNNVPTDKATFDVAVTVASDLTAVSNGVLASAIPHGDGTTTYEWVGLSPMAPYLATVTVGDLDDAGSDFSDPERPLYIYVDRSFRPNAATIVANQQQVPAILDWLAGYYGVPYPFEAAGGVVPRVGGAVGYVLETQTKPTYPSANAASRGVSIATIAHENAHQWFGNLVTLARWRDIWLNEGITEFSSWLWETDTAGGPSMPDRFDEVYDTSPDGFWVTPPADPPTAADIFDSDAMYTRGATTMTAIREIFIATPSLGEDAFRAMMRRWLTDHAFGNVTTEDFVALVQATDPGRADRWAAFLQQWLYTSYSGDPALPGNKPAITPATF